MTTAAHPLIIPFFIPHAGCPYTCSFCNQRIITGTSFSLPDKKQITETIELWLQRSPARPTEVAFFGGSFSLLPAVIQRQLLATVQPFLTAGRIAGIRISTRPDALDQDELTLLAAHGVRTIEIGVQSLDDQVLLLAGRGHTANDSLQALRRVADAGFTVGAQLLPGLPGETPETAVQGVKEVIAGGAAFIRIYPVVVLEGTRLAELYLSGLYTPPDLETGVRTAARMLHLALRTGVPVIRIGLQADDGLSHKNGVVLAGCWHPALGQLVRGQLYHDLVVKLAANMSELDTPLQLFCAPRNISEVQGHGKYNLKRWQQAGLMVNKLEADAQLGEQQIMLRQLQHKVIGSLITDCIYEENFNA